MKETSGGFIRRSYSKADEVRARGFDLTFEP